MLTAQVGSPEILFGAFVISGGFGAEYVACARTDVRAEPVRNVAWFLIGLQTPRANAWIPIHIAGIFSDFFLYVKSENGLKMENVPCSSSAVQETVSHMETDSRNVSLVQMQVRLWISQSATEAAW